jgi:hypothetical protein
VPGVGIEHKFGHPVVAAHRQRTTGCNLTMPARVVARSELRSCCSGSLSLLMRSDAAIGQTAIAVAKPS